jgi:hypothetical protein
MDEESQNGRIGILSILFLSAIVVALMVVALIWFARAQLFAPKIIPQVPLKDAVASFNLLAKSDRIGADEPQLTESEILAAIKRQLPTLASQPRVQQTFVEIVNTSQLPGKARLYFMNGYTDASRASKAVWWINLEVQVPDEGGHALRIRENNSPRAVAPVQPTKVP